MNSVTIESYKQIIADQQHNSTLRCIDVRSREEYQAEHIEGVVNIPLSELEHHMDVFQNVHEVYVQCQGGGRSAAAIMALSQMLPQVTFYNVDGGLIAWKQAGYPTVSS